MRCEVEGVEGVGFSGLVLDKQKKITHAWVLLCGWQSNLETETCTTDAFSYGWQEKFFFFKFCVVWG